MGQCLFYKKMKKLFKSRKGHSSQIHIMIGFVLLAMLYFLNQKYMWVDMQSLTYSQIAFIAFITWAYSQMPDIDIPTSKISDYMTIFGLGIILYSFAYGDKTLGIWTAIILGIVKLIQHRTIIHSLGAGIIISAPLYFLNPLYGIIALIMFLAHIISENEFSLWSEKDFRIFEKS